MRYLFFDIECAEGSRAICEFGYTICDTNFKALNNKNILIHPDAKFNLTGREGQKDLILTYPYEEYYKHPKFTEFYDNIKFLLSQKDIVIFGHSAGNDINFLFKDCNRYSLDLFDFDVYDTQRIYKELSKSNPRQTALEVAYENLVDEEIRNTLRDHRASDDSLKTMYILKGMVEKLDFTVNELLSSCPKSVIHALSHFRLGRERAKARKKKKYLSPAQKTINAEGEAKWRELTTEHEPLLEDESSIGKFVKVSSEVKHKKESIDIVIKLIKENGYVAINSISGCDYLVVSSAAEGKEIQDAFKYPFGGKIITLEDFVNLNNK